MKFKSRPVKIEHHQEPQPALPPPTTATAAEAVSTSPAAVASHSEAATVASTVEATRTGSPATEPAVKEEKGSYIHDLEILPWALFLVYIRTISPMTDRQSNNIELRDQRYMRDCAASGVQVGAEG